MDSNTSYYNKEIYGEEEFNLEYYINLLKVKYNDYPGYTNKQIQETHITIMEDFGIYPYKIIKDFNITVY